MFIWKVVFFISIWKSVPVASLASEQSSTADDRLFKPIYACEHSELQIGCEEGRVIHIIRANYGRLNMDLCNNKEQVDWTGHCISDTSQHIMIDRCEQKQNCSVKASNTVFGDPCHGTIKYLEVQHVCVSPAYFTSTTSGPTLSNISATSNLDSTPETTSDNRHLKTIRTCENNEFYASCEDDQVIHIIRANYGRLTVGMCKDICEVVWNGHCISNTSNLIMIDRCEQRQSCSVLASNYIFGDPCYGTLKYLEVQYVCVPPSNFTSTTETYALFNIISPSGHRSLPETKLEDDRLFKPIYSCEHSELQIVCEEDRVIHIIRANYGRLNIDFCNNSSQVDWDGYCISNSSYDIMIDKCEQKQRCNVEASDSIFGNPCPGTVKYLEVQHVCVSPSNFKSTERILSMNNSSSPPELESEPDTTLDSRQFKTIISCENSELNVNCEEGRVIHIIRANYGRLTAGMCNDTCELNWNGHCISSRSSFIMINRCERKQRCSVQASNAIFGDPCFGTLKYLEVQYVCVSPSYFASTTGKPTIFKSSSTSELDSSLDSSLFKTQYSCEHNELYIGCVEVEVIHVIRANYGRLTRDLCNDDGQVVWPGGHCMSEISYRIMIDRCERKQRCSVQASNAIFGDPCFGTLKYLEVQYVCVSPSYFASTTGKPTIFKSSSTSELDSSLDSSLFKTQYSCEHNELYIGCVEVEVIHVIRANYGRLTRDLCNDDGQVVWPGGHCMSEISYRIMIDRCEHKQSCSVLASNSIFGDPCRGTIKYLEVQYVCVSPSSITAKPVIFNGSSTSDLDFSLPVPDTSLDSRPSKTTHTCEHNELYMSCEEGRFIHIIRANYGRLNRDLCNDDGQVVWSGEHCISERSDLIMSDRCEQKQSCNVRASNYIFGDPCVGTIKYLEVQYVCVSIPSALLPSEQSSRDDNKTKHLYSCEHNNLHLSCEEGRVIHLYRANYGRLTRDLCNDDGQVVWSGKDCMAYSSYTIMNNRCEQKQSCTVQASNYNFGDPCRGTIKYLEVEYDCVSPSNSTSTTSKPTIFNDSTSHLVSLPDTSFDSGPYETIHTCEHNTLRIGCEEGGVIRIIRTNYGRLNRNFCNDDGRVFWSGEDCMSEISYSKLSNRCDEKVTCRVLASNSIFGDPCPGTIKYLEVQYVCVPPSNSASTTSKHTIFDDPFTSDFDLVTDTSLDTMTITKTCEHNELYLNCEEGKVIHIIRANYGRLNNDVCNDDGNVEWSFEDCEADTSFLAVNERCEQKKSCSVPASNSVFGDPCRGTIKYLEVQYACISPSNPTSTTSKPKIFIDSSATLPDTSLDSRPFKIAYACEHNELHVRCEGGRVIHILRANYGRFTRDTCNDDGQVVWTGEHCTSERSYSKMSNACEQKESCSVLASNSVFGDPCRGTIKYLELKYVCVLPINFTSATESSIIFTSSTPPDEYLETTEPVTLPSTSSRSVTEPSTPEKDLQSSVVAYPCPFYLLLRIYLFPNIHYSRELRNNKGIRNEAADNIGFDPKWENFRRRFCLNVNLDESVRDTTDSLLTQDSDLFDPSQDMAIMVNTERQTSDFDDMKENEIADEKYVLVPDLESSSLQLDTLKQGGSKDRLIKERKYGLSNTSEDVIKNAKCYLLYLKSTQVQDADEAYGHYIAKSLRSIVDPEEREMARVKLQKVLMKLKFEKDAE